MSFIFINVLSNLKLSKLYLKKEVFILLIMQQI